MVYLGADYTCMNRPITIIATDVAIMSVIIVSYLAFRMVVPTAKLTVIIAVAVGVFVIRTATIIPAIEVSAFIADFNVCRRKFVDEP